MNGLDNETLITIQETAVKASGAAGKAVVLELPGEPDGRYAIVKPNGDINVLVPKPRPRSHQLGSIGEISDFLSHVEERLESRPSLWYAADGITILLDDTPESQRSDRCTVKFELTPEFQTVLSLHERQFSQKDFLKLFRIRLADCIESEERQLLIKVLRVIDFNSSTSGHGKIEHGRESIGLDIEAEIRSAAGDIPDEITLSVCLYQDPQLVRRFPIRCAIEVNPRETYFELLPLAGEIVQARNEQMTAVGTFLDQELKVPIFFGKP